MGEATTRTSVRRDAGLLNPALSLCGVNVNKCLRRGQTGRRRPAGIKREEAENEEGMSIVHEIHALLSDKDAPVRWVG